MVSLMQGRKMVNRRFGWMASSYNTPLESYTTTPVNMALSVSNSTTSMAARPTGSAPARPSTFGLMTSWFRRACAPPQAPDLSCPSPSKTTTQTTPTAEHAKTFQTRSSTTMMLLISARPSISNATASRRTSDAHAAPQTSSAFSGSPSSDSAALSPSASLMTGSETSSHTALPLQQSLQLLPPHPRLLHQQPQKQPPQPPNQKPPPITHPHRLFSPRVSALSLSRPASRPTAAVMSLTSVLRRISTTHSACPRASPFPPQLKAGAAASSHPMPPQLLPHL